MHNQNTRKKRQKRNKEEMEQGGENERETLLYHSDKKGTVS